MKNFNVLNPDYESDIREKLQRQFFMKLMGFNIDSIQPGRVTGSLQIEEKHMQQNYMLHGGAIATAADIVMGFAAYSLAPKGSGVVTIDLQVSYLNPGKGEMLIAEGWVVKPGSSIFFCSADLYVIRDGEKIHTNRANATMHRIVF
ncbi:MAG: hotdog fold thioesterase [Bacteroidetes bacterium]|nr:hotdog fold thioesterase [Bacteroidota bacterium]